VSKGVHPKKAPAMGTDNAKKKKTLETSSVKSELSGREKPETEGRREDAVSTG